MKSMVKILVTIMALSLAEAPVFAAWPQKGMKKPEKVQHLVNTYGSNAAEINKLTVPQLNALEAQLSGAAVVLAPVDMAMVVVRGAGLDIEAGGGEAVPADEVFGGGADGGAVEVPVVAVKRQRIEGTRVDFPQLDSELEVPPTDREMLIAKGLFEMAKTAEVSASNALSGFKAHFEPGGDKAGMDISKCKHLPIYQGKAAHATQDRRKAQAQNAFLLKRNSLSPFFDGINQQLGALIASDAVLTAADINAFIVMIEEVIGAVRQEDGTMSSGTTAELRALMPPYAQYASNLEVYVRELRAALTDGSFAPCAEALNPVGRQGYAQRVRSFLTTSRFLIAAATLAGVFGGLQAGIVLTDVIILDMGVIPFGSIPCTQLFMAGTSALGGAFAGRSVARLATGPATESSAKKRTHDGDDKV